MKIAIVADTPAATVTQIAELARVRVRQIQNADPMFKLDSDGARASELSDFADYLGRVEVNPPEAGEVAVTDNAEDWRTGTRALNLDRDALSFWSSAMSYYIKMRDRKFRGETAEQADARIAYMRGLHREVTDALNSYGPLPGLHGHGMVAEVSE